MADPACTRSSLLQTSGRRVDCTCEWIQDDPAYGEWLDRRSLGFSGSASRPAPVRLSCRSTSPIYLGVARPRTPWSRRPWLTSSARRKDAKSPATPLCYPARPPAAAGGLPETLLSVLKSGFYQRMDSNGGLFQRREQRYPLGQLHKGAGPARSRHALYRHRQA